MDIIRKTGIKSLYTGFDAAIARVIMLGAPMMGFYKTGYRLVNEYA